MNQNKVIGSALRFVVLASSIFLFPQAQALACSTNGWSSTQGTAVTAENAAVYEGDCGLRLNLDGAATGLVKDDTPGTVTPAVSEYVARFYAYFDDAQLTNGQGFTIFSALNAGSNELFSLEVTGSNMGPVLAVYDAGTSKVSGDIPVPTGWRAITLHWTTGANGALKLIVDREQDGMTQAITGLSNAGQEIGSVQLGVVTNVPGIAGIIDADAFFSRRTGTTGLANQKACSGTNVIKNITFLNGPITCSNAGALSFGNRVTFDPGATVDVVAASVTMGRGTSIPHGAALDISIQ